MVRVKWEMVHPSFPRQTISEFCNKDADSEINSLYAYSALSPLINEKVPLPPPSEKCKDLKEKIISKWRNTFKEKLDLHDKMKIKPLKIELKPDAVRCYNANPYDTPFHLREPYEREIKDMVDGGLLVPCCLETSKWCSRAFPVLKSNKKNCPVVADFKISNKNIVRPHHLTESSGQLLRHVSPKAKVFAKIDLLSGYSQVPVDEESSELLVIATPSGRFRYRVLAQGITSASDIFNVVTDGQMRYSTDVLKNIDDLLFSGENIEELQEKIERFLVFAEEKNMKNKISKFEVSKHIEFGGALISSKLISNNQVVTIQPRDGRIQAFFDLKKPSSKKELQSFCGFLSSLQSWQPSVSLTIPLLRKACGEKSNKLVWNDEMEVEYNEVVSLMQKQIKLSPYDPSKHLCLIIDGQARSVQGLCLRRS